MNNFIIINGDLEKKFFSVTHKPKSSSRRLNRYNKRKAFKHREYIIAYHGGYIPFVGRYKSKRKYDPQTDRYEYVIEKRQIQYCHHSKRQQYLKRKTNKVIRKLPLEEIYGKGNIYRRYFCV